jgi:hypothetical protein
VLRDAPILPSRDVTSLTTAPLRVRSIFLVLLVAMGVLGCGGPREAPAPRKPPPPDYSPEAAVLFDDVFASELFGFNPEGRDPAKDPKLPERTANADFVAPVRVETLSRSGGGKLRGTYEVVLHVTGKALVGEVPSGRLVVVAPAGSPSHTWLEGAGMAWVGTRLLLFGKRFRGGALHFRGEPDTEAVRAAVDRGSGLRVLKE